jgi:hypothetical protein
MRTRCSSAVILKAYIWWRNFMDLNVRVCSNAYLCTRCSSAAILKADFWWRNFMDIQLVCAVSLSLYKIFILQLHLTSLTSGEEQRKIQSMWRNVSLGCYCEGRHLWWRNFMDLTVHASMPICVQDFTFAVILNANIWWRNLNGPNRTCSNAYDLYKIFILQLHLISLTSGEEQQKSQTCADTSLGYNSEGWWHLMKKFYGPNRTCCNAYLCTRYSSCEDMCSSVATDVMMMMTMVIMTKMSMAMKAPLALLPMPWWCWWWWRWWWLWPWWLWW